MNKYFLQLLRQAKAGGFPARNPAPTSFPFDNPLTFLNAKGRYFQRQAQEGIKTGIDAAKGFFGRVQGLGPTAINPLATRTPSTQLGQVGKLVNPLNPTNFAGLIAGPVINTFVPESMRNTARVGAYTPGGLPIKVLAAGLYDTFLNSRNAGVALANGTLQANAPEEYARQQIFRAEQAKAQQRPIGSISKLNGNEVAWRGPDLGWQRTYSENIQNQSANVGWPSTYVEGVSPPSPPAIGSPQNLLSGQQAGQVRPNVIPNVISNGAGVLAQKPNVVNRALSQEVLNAAQQFNAPANVSLPSFYEGQQQLGRSMMQNGTLVSQLQELGGAPGMTPENLKIWAAKNPALAYRELLKLREHQ